jgi:hypothetical protein
MLQAVLLFGLLLFLSWFSVKTTMMVRYLTLGLLVYSVLFLAIDSFRYEMGPQAYSVISAVRPLAYMMILLAWFWAMRQTRKYPENGFVPIFSFSHGQEQKLLAQLEGLNASLGRALQR